MFLKASGPHLLSDYISNLLLNYNGDSIKFDYQNELTVKTSIVSE